MTQNNQERASRIFTVVLLLAVLYFSYLFFKPYLLVIAIAGVLVAIFYPLYKKFLFWTRGKVSLSAIAVCLLVLLIIIVPFSYFAFFLAQRSIEAYSTLSPSINGGVLEFVDAQLIERLDFIDPQVFDVRQTIIDSVIAVRGAILTGATALVRGTTGFVFGLILTLFTMYYLFIDGPALLRRVMRLTPLSNKYDKLIWNKFRDVSHTVMVSTFVTAVAQGVVGAIGFLIVGFPAVIASILMAIASLIPYVGTTLVWGPIAIYLLLTGQIWQGVFLLAWGMIAIGLTDNLLRPYLIKGKAKVHPLIIFFSILGGISLMGFWGIIFGPLVVSLAVTMLHIYELEFSDILER